MVTDKFGGLRQFLSGKLMGFLLVFLGLILVGCMVGLLVAGACS
jgi:hypothetical protein